MRVVKNINNNVSLCLDSTGREVIAFGKGIGFTKPPYEIPLQKVERTFYDINSDYLAVIAQIPEDIIEVSSDIVNYANKELHNQYSANTIFTLADHIQFAIKRQMEDIHIKSPLVYEVRNLYPQEIGVARKALCLIEEKLNVKLEEDEVASIAMHLVNYGKNAEESHSIKLKSKVEICSDIVERMMDIKIDKTSFKYSRFITHMHYLMDRVHKNEQFVSENAKLFNEMIESYPKTYSCAVRIQKELDINLDDEEVLYMILHINRLCSKEDCNR